MCIVLNEIDLESLKFVSLFDRFNIIIRHKRSALYGKLIAKQQNETTFASRKDKTGAKNILQILYWCEPTQRSFLQKSEHIYSAMTTVDFVIGHLKPTCMSATIWMRALC